MKERQVATKTEQIIIDSRYRTSGDHNDYTISLKGIGSMTSNTYSKVFFSNFDQVVGIRVIGVFIQNTRVDNSSLITGVDFVCPQIPKKAQQLSAAHGYVWCRVPITRRYAWLDGTNLRDQWWEAPYAKTQLFPPQQLTELSISLWGNLPTPELYSDKDNYLIVEITSLERHQDNTAINI